MEVLENAVEKLSNTMRKYIEERIHFERIKNIDLEEAINNLDRAFESKLEAFHSVYDLSKEQFEYFNNVDTSLLILLRNAIHHRDHLLFNSWNNEMHLKKGMVKKSGNSFLMVENGTFEGNIGRYYYKLEDILNRIDDSRNSKYIEKKMTKKNREKLLNLLNTELLVPEIIKASTEKGYSSSNIYINIIPIFISSIQKVFSQLIENGLKPSGYDSNVYIDFFTNEKKVDLKDLNYSIIKLPKVN